MQSAEARLAIVDKYLDDSVFDMLQAISGDVEVSMVTSNLKPMFPVLLAALRSERGKVNAKVHKHLDFHDRFLVIDDKDVWQLGCSINGLGRATARLSRVRDTAEQTRLRSLYDKAWRDGVQA